MTGLLKARLNSLLIIAWTITMIFYHGSAMVGPVTWNNTSSQPDGTPEPEGTSEQDGTLEPEGTSAPDGTSEHDGISEPEGASETEGAAEPEETPEPEGTSDTEGATEPEEAPEPEGTSEPGGIFETEGTFEPEGEDPTGEGEPEVRPDIIEIVGPSFGIVVILLSGLMGLSLWTNRVAVLTFLGKRIPCIKIPESKQSKVCVTKETNEVTDTAENDDEFFSQFDIEVLDSLEVFHNRIGELIRVASPALLSLVLCPFTLYLYKPLVEGFWPETKMLPNVNEAIACFLAPAGLVYATSFGFAFQQALTKQTALVNKISRELGLLDQIVSLTTKLSFDSMSSRMAVYRAVKAEAVFMALQIENTQPENFRTKPRENVKVRLWSIIDTLRSVNSDCVTQAYDMDRIIADNIVKHMLQLNSICSDRMGTMHTRIHPLKWMFLESLGFFSFFGILLTSANSYRMELTMCIITVFSISLLCYVVSDFDSPFSGFFRIDVSCLLLVVQRAHAQFLRAKMGNNTMVNYPQN